MFDAFRRHDADRNVADRRDRFEDADLTEYRVDRHLGIRSIQGRPVLVDLRDRCLNVSPSGLAPICSRGDGLLAQLEANAGQPRQSATWPCVGEVQQDVDVAVWPSGALGHRSEQPRVAGTVPGEHIADLFRVLA
jgi:hypothetical protein